MGEDKIRQFAQFWLLSHLDDHPNLADDMVIPTFEKITEVTDSPEKFAIFLQSVMKVNLNFFQEAAFGAGPLEDFLYKNNPIPKAIAKTLLESESGRNLLRIVDPEAISDPLFQVAVANALTGRE